MGKRIVMTCPVTGDSSLTPPSCKWRLPWYQQRWWHYSITLTSASARIRAGWEFVPLSLLIILITLEFTEAKWTSSYIGSDQIFPHTIIASAIGYSKCEPSQVH